MLAGESISDQTPSSRRLVRAAKAAQGNIKTGKNPPCHKSLTLAFEHDFDLEIAKHRSNPPKSANSYDAKIDPERG